MTGRANEPQTDEYAADPEEKPSVSGATANEEPDYPELGRILRELIGGMSLRTAARKTGVNHNTLSRLKNGVRGSVDSLIKIADAFHIDPNRLLRAAGYPEIYRGRFRVLPDGRLIDVSLDEGASSEFESNEDSDEDSNGVESRAPISRRDAERRLIETLIDSINTLTAETIEIQARLYGYERIKKDYDAIVATMPDGDSRKQAAESSEVLSRIIDGLEDEFKTSTSHRVRLIKHVINLLDSAFPENVPLIREFLDRINKKIDVASTQLPVSAG